MGDADAARGPRRLLGAAFACARHSDAGDGCRPTDEAGLLARAGTPVAVVEGDARNVKVTTPTDWSLADALWPAWAAARRRLPFHAPPPGSMRIGHGYDVHRLVAGRPLILGGVTVPSDVGLDGHSDADVLTHAVIDALLGAAALGDIGSHFPDTDAD